MPNCCRVALAGHPRKRKPATASEPSKAECGICLRCLEHMWKSPRPALNHDNTPSDWFSTPEFDSSEFPSQLSQTSPFPAARQGPAAYAVTAEVAQFNAAFGIPVEEQTGRIRRIEQAGNPYQRYIQSASTRKRRRNVTAVEPIRRQRYRVNSSKYLLQRHRQSRFWLE